MATSNHQMLEMLVDDLNYIRNNMPEYIQAIKEAANDQSNKFYFISLINEVAGLRAKIEQAIFDAQ